MAEVLLPSEKPQVKRRSSIDQFKGTLSVWKQGGWAPVAFDQLDGIVCETIKTHPAILSLDENDIGYIFPEAHCTYVSDRFVYFDKEGVEQRLLPACFGGKGEFYDEYIYKNTFVNADFDTSVGTHNKIQLRGGLSYCLADENLPAVS